MIDPPRLADIFIPSSRPAFNTATPSYAELSVQSSTDLQSDLDGEYELANTFKRFYNKYPSRYILRSQLLVSVKIQDQHILLGYSTQLHYCNCSPTVDQSINI